MTEPTPPSATAVQCRCGEHYDLAVTRACPACGTSPTARPIGRPMDLSSWEAALLRQLAAKDADQQEAAGNPEAAMARRALAVRLFHHAKDTAAEDGGHR